MWYQRGQPQLLVPQTMAVEIEDGLVAANLTSAEAARWMEKALPVTVKRLLLDMKALMLGFHVANSKLPSPRSFPILVFLLVLIAGCPYHPIIPITHCFGKTASPRQVLRGLQLFLTLPPSMPRLLGPMGGPRLHTAAACALAMLAQIE